MLGTQAELARETQSYADALNDVTSALARNDSADLKTLLNNAPEGLDAATATVADLQQVLPMMLANLTTNAEVLNTYLPNVKQILVLYPSLVARLQTAVNPRAGLGDVQLDLRAGVNNPPTCQTGYLPANERRSPGITTTRDVNRLAHCEIAPDNPTAVRGGRNLPCPHSSTRGPLPAACGITFRGGIWPDSSGTVAYDIAVGRGDDAAASDVTPDQQAEDEDLWKVLVLVPLERS